MPNMVFFSRTLGIQIVSFFFLTFSKISNFHFYFKLNYNFTIFNISVILFL